MSRKDLRVFGRRLAICFLIALAFAILISEVAYRFQKDRVNRPPQAVELVIPAGTAEQVQQGNPVPSIPEEMDFLIGDVLVVINEDSVDHQLGPVWVPPASRASLPLELADKFSFACSFKPGRYLGINVREPTTLITRLTGLGLITPPTAMILLVYSILVFPLQAKGRPKSGKREPGSGPYVRSVKPSPSRNE